MTRRDLQFARARAASAVVGSGQGRRAVSRHQRRRGGHRVRPPKSDAIELRVNGETRQQSALSLLIHGLPEIVAHLSGFYRLQPSDVIFTGTPEGVGPVKSGDRPEDR